MAEDPSHPSQGFAFGLTEPDVEEFRSILKEESGESLDSAQAWARATEVLSLFHHVLNRPVDSAQGGLELPPRP